MGSASALVVRDSEPVGGYPYARWRRMAGAAESQQAHERQTGRSVNRQSEIHTTHRQSRPPPAPHATPPSPRDPCLWSRGSTPTRICAQLAPTLLSL